MARVIRLTEAALADNSERHLLGVVMGSEDRPARSTSRIWHPP
jgi:hypothetical protein